LFLSWILISAALVKKLSSGENPILVIIVWMKNCEGDSFSRLEGQAACGVYHPDFLFLAWLTV
jgi:hypothetical protein